MDSSRSFGRYKRPLGAVVVFGLILVGLLSFGPPSSTYSTYLPNSSHPTTLSAEDLDRALGALKGPTSPAESPVGVPSSSEEQPKEEKAAVVVKPDRSKVRCALYDGQYFHEEVWGAALYSLAQWGCDLNLYHMTYKDKFEVITGTLWEHEKDRLMKWPTTILDPLDKGEIDIIFVTSGDDGWIDSSVMAAMVRARQTQIVVIMHQMENFGPERTTFLEIARQGRLTFAGLGESTVNIMNHKISEWAMEDQEVAWDRVPVEMFIPIFPLDYAASPKHHKIPSRVVIQGKVESSRRNYGKIIEELFTYMTEDPAAWGYAVVEGTKALEPIPDHADVFQLHLLGQMNDFLQWPEELNKVIVVHQTLEYDEYYRTLLSMDLLLPAFAGLHYLRDKTSSSIPAAVLGRVPVLASALALKVYEFLLPPAIVPYPAGQTEVASIKRLREGKSLWDSERDLYVALNQARKSKAPSQVHAHWDTYLQDTPDLNDAWEAYQKSLYVANGEIWERTFERMEVQRKWIGLE